MKNNPIEELRVSRPDLFDAPPFWPVHLDDIAKLAEKTEIMRPDIIGRSAGGRDIWAFSSGEFEPRRPTATISSAMASDRPECFFDYSAGTRQSLVLIGSIHGGETEGIATCMNIISIIESGRDLAGNARTRLRDLLKNFRLNIIPCLNPDGRATAGVAHLSNAEIDHIYLVQQGIMKDGSLFKGREIKETQPVPKDFLAFRGGYYNDDGVNLQHDDFFSAELAPENKALIKLFKKEMPDAFLTFHAHGAPPAFTGPDLYLFPGYREKQIEAISYIGEFCARKHMKIEESVPQPTASFYFQTYFSHLCGAIPLLFELPHGTVNCPFSLETILEQGLTVVEGWADFALNRRFEKYHILEESVSESSMNAPGVSSSARTFSFSASFAKAFRHRSFGYLDIRALIIFLRRWVKASLAIFDTLSLISDGAAFGDGVNSTKAD